MRKKVSIIIPAYNAEKYIERCLNSILNQTYNNLEIFVINDGSTDNTEIICNKIAKKDKRLIIETKINEGVSKARNYALKKVSGDYILFVDSDDWLENNMVEKMIKSSQENHSDIVFCEYNNYYEDSKKIERVYLNKYNYNDCLNLISDPKTNFGGVPWNKLLKSKLVTKSYNENVHFFENLLFFLENLSDKTSFSVINEPLYNYSINDTSALHSKKYSIKKVSALDALEIIIPITPIENIDFHKMLYINSYYENLYHLKKEKINNISLKKYYPNVCNFFNDIMKCNNISLKQKIKLFILHRLNFIYIIKKNMTN